MTDAHRHVQVRDLDGGAPRTDRVVIEEPLDIRVAGPQGRGATLAVTMRTPGDDLALAIGLCWSEGLLDTPRDLLDASWCPPPEDGPPPPSLRRPVLVRLSRAPDLGEHHRHGVMTSACGVCGRTTIDDLERRVATVGAAARRDTDPVDPRVLRELPERLREVQEVFGRTGGLHAVGRFSVDGRLVDHAEDVGRHNAFDKVAGRAVRAGDVDWSGDIVLLSGRASYELLAKAAMLRVGVVAAIGAPSSLAVEVADRFGICLVGFLRGARGNVHTHPGRLAAATELTSTSPGARP